GGLEMGGGGRFQAWGGEWRSRSPDRLPSGRMVPPTRAVRSPPAFGIGAEFCVFTMTTAGRLAARPSLTVSWTRNTPGASTTNSGVAEVGRIRIARLVSGFSRNDHS